MPFRYRSPRIHYRPPRIPVIRPPRINTSIVRTHNLMRMAGIRTFNSARPNRFPRYRYRTSYTSPKLGKSSWVGLICFIILCVIALIAFL